VGRIGAKQRLGVLDADAPQQTNQAADKFNSLIGLGLLLGQIEEKIAGHRADFTQMVGPVNRPGPRGLSIDREASPNI
jgi:hypothetical protein